MQLHPSRAGARLARELAARWLADHGMPQEVTDDALQVVGELTANAALHGRVPGRRFQLVLRLTGAGRTLRVEVTDTRTEKQPPATPTAPDALSESGRGLLLVAALADDWGVSPRRAAPGKTVWAILHAQPKGHPLTHRVAPEPDLDLLSATSSPLRDDLGSRPEDANHEGRRQ